jgi:hypothetical protein
MGRKPPVNPPVPLGHYRCPSGHEWETVPGLTECPVCGAYERIEWLNWPAVCLAVHGRKGE